MLEMLDEYSKGKVLTIQTQQKRKKKKNKKKQKRQDQDEFADDLEFSDNEFDQSEDEENVERQFNFVVELSRLVDYEVIEKYTYMLSQHQMYRHRPILIKACSSFFKRIISQTKQTWIFFQLDTLSVFNDFLQKDIANNSLMKGIMEHKASTVKQRQLEAYSIELKSVVTMVVGKFTELLKRNKMLGVEILFRFASKDIKDQILNNYEERAARAPADKAKHQAVQQQDELQEAVIDMNNFNIEEEDIREDVLQLGLVEHDKHSSNDGDGNDGGFHWTQDKDEILINNYSNFISLGKKGCFEMISMLIEGTTAKQCYERGKELGLKKLSVEECRARSMKLVSEHKTSSFSNKKVLYALRKFVLSKLDASEGSLEKARVAEYIDFVKKVCADYEEFRTAEDNMVLFGGELELNDIKRVVQ
jgi:hypothetical protein